MENSENKNKDQERLDKMINEYVKLYLYVFGNEIYGDTNKKTDKTEGSESGLEKIDETELAFKNLDKSLAVYSMGSAKSQYIEVSAKDLKIIIDWWRNEKLKQVRIEKNEEDWKVLGEEC